MSKLEWLIEKAKSNKNHFQATFKESFIHGVNTEAMLFGANLESGSYIWTVNGKGYTLTAKNPKYKGQRGKVSIEIVDIEFHSTEAKLMQQTINQARTIKMPYDQIATFEKMLLQRLASDMS